MKFMVGIGAIFLAGLIGSQFVSIFIIQPIGAIPEGKTLVISRLKSVNFIDSADAWCKREMGYVNLICRAGVISRVANEADIIMRLPYSGYLYELSTGGVRYSR